MRALIALTAVAVLLAACEPEAPGGGAAPPPADAPAPVGAPERPEGPEPASTPANSPETPASAEPVSDMDIVMIGTEPFWRLDVKSGELSLSRPDSAVVRVRNADFSFSPPTAVFTGKAGDQTLVARLTKGRCSDGMSDRTYPYRAEVTLGDLTLKGCGIMARDFAAMPPA